MTIDEIFYLWLGVIAFASLFPLAVFLLSIGKDSVTDCRIQFIRGTAWCRTHNRHADLCKEKK
jgi:hypothetical protein